ncbi:MAG: aspartyl protease family protein [Pyrinomonadaceae bacterium]
MFVAAAGARSVTAQTAVVDVPMIMRGPMPAVEVMVNGKGPFLFAIDTGASGQARADSSLVAKLSLPDAGEVRGTDGSGSAGTQMKVVILDSVKIGGLEVRSVSAPSRNYNLSPNLPKIDGILGFGFFADHLLTLDYAGKRVKITQGKLPAANGKDILDFKAARGGAPSLDLTIGGTKVMAHIDTGNTVGQFVLPSATAEKLTFIGEPVVKGRARTVTSEIEIKEVKIKEMIKLGQFEFPQPLITFPGVSHDVNMGSRALADLSVTFDQKNKRLRLSGRKTGKSQ